MNISQSLASLFGRIPRRYTPENVKEIYAILDEYDNLLRSLEANPEYEKEVAVFFDDMDTVRETIKNSSLNKHSKQVKDKLFDEGSGVLKDSMENLEKMYEGS
jgi:hypothetical protein